EVRVGADPQHLRVPVLEVAVAAAELRDLRRAYEREVHGPQERHRPLAGVALLRDLLELAALLAAHHRLELEGRELVANGQHGSSFVLLPVLDSVQSSGQKESVTGAGERPPRGPSSRPGTRAPRTPSASPPATRPPPPRGCRGCGPSSPR